MIFKTGTDACKYSGYFILSHNLSQQRIEPMQSLDNYNIIAGNNNLLLSAFQAAVCVKVKGWNDGFSLVYQFVNAAIDPLNIQCIDAFKIWFSLTV